MNVNANFTPDVIKKMSEMEFPKSKFRMKVTEMEKQETDNGPAYKVTKSQWIKGNRREFIESIAEDLTNGIDRTIEVVNREPEKFKINQIYMLATKDVVWVYMEK